MSEKSGFEELMSQGTAIITHPVTPWLALGVIALFWILSQVDSKIPEDPIERLKRNLGAEKIHHGFALVAALLWFVLVLLLIVGLIKLLSDIVWNTAQPVEREAKADFRFLLTKTAALTAVLGAMIALPFTALRLKHSRDVLFNDKLNDANADLHAMRQVTVPVLDKNGEDTRKRETIWQDDIIRRNGAIDRLEALAIERPAMAPRIARMLSVYLREMTRDYPAEKIPTGLEGFELSTWANSLEVKRTDMETAAQILGRLHELTQVTTKDLAIDLTGVNLQAMQLSDLNFEQAKLERAALDGANLCRAELNEANLFGAQLNGAELNWARLNEANLNGAQLNGAQLNGAMLNDAQLNWAQLNGAQLNRAHLNGAQLNWAQLDGAQLNEARLNGAQLNEAQLNGAQLNGAQPQ